MRYFFILVTSCLSVFLVFGLLISSSSLAQEGRVVDTVPLDSIDTARVAGDTIQGDSSVVSNATDTTSQATTEAAGSTATPNSESETAEPASKAWFSAGRLNVLILISILIAAILYYIQRAKSGRPLYIRKLPGLEAVDEAVGRATEMGKKIYFIPGIQDMNDVQTIAGIAILGRVASLAAEYETWLEVPTSKSLVMITATETMREAYTKAGRPDSYQDAQVHFITDEQFAYAAALDGMIVREKPATILYMGAFYAESLILSEVGNTTGAIQIAGTAEATQLPFFVAACDYTLLGEELFAASAYLSKEPRQLGSLRGQDIGKAIFIAAIIFGIIGETTGWYSLIPWFEAK